MNLGPTGYEPVALTTELWARSPYSYRRALEKRFELAAPRWMAELSQRFGLDLPDALARDRKALSDFFERVLASVADAEAHLDDFLFSRCQRLEDRFGHLLQVGVDDLLWAR